MGDDAHNKFQRINSLPYPKKTFNPQHILTESGERASTDTPGIRELIIYTSMTNHSAEASG